MGACRASTPRSLRTSSSRPSSTARSAAAHSAVERLRRAPRRDRRRSRRRAIGSTAHAGSRRAAPARSFASSSFVRIGLLELEQATLPRRLGEEVPLAAEAAHERHHELLADRVDRRVGDLGELLLEVAEERAAAGRSGRRAARRSPCCRSALRRSSPSARGARAGPRASSRTRAGGARRSVASDGGERRDRRAATRARSCSPSSHCAYGFCAAISRLISSSPTMRPRASVDEEHLARLEAPLLDDVLRLEVDARRARSPRRRSRSR